MVTLKEPYVPGFLAFREVEFLVSLLQTLRASQPELFPECVMVDGNGELHPRGFGLACHLGVLLDLPTIGTRGQRRDRMPPSPPHHSSFLPSTHQALAKRCSTWTGWTTLPCARASRPSARAPAIGCRSSVSRVADGALPSSPATMSASLSL